MIRSYLRTAWQNLRSHQSYVAINTIGLAVGLGVCLLIFVLIRYETSFDDFHENKDRIYRMVSAVKAQDGIKYSQASAFPVADALRIDYPQLEQVVRTYGRRGSQISIQDNKGDAPTRKFKENVFFAEPGFFHLFHFPFLAGNAETALSEVNTAVFTQQTAEKYFGDWHDAIGKFIRYDNDKICKITGILENVPANTDFTLDIVFSFKTTAGEDFSNDWSGQDGSLNTYVLLPKNMSARAFDGELKDFVKKHTPVAYANHGYMLQPLSAIHYQSEFGNYKERTFSRELISAISLVGLFLLIIACINFINLATAQAVNRSKEVGIRKVLGSSKRQLIIQFLSETFIITLFAIVTALLLAFIVLPVLNQILQTSLEIPVNFSMIAFLTALTVVVTFLSGFYPAIVLSGFNPIAVLKNKFSGKTAGGLSMRKALVVFQFTIAQTLIMATLIAVSQMNFFRNASLGFDKEAVVIVPLGGDSTRLTRMNTLKTQLLQLAGVKNVSMSTFTPMDDAGWDGDFRFDNSTEKQDFHPEFKWADADYFKTYNIQFVAGKPYRPSDTVNEYVINEMLAKKLGFKKPEDILGKKMDFADGSLVGNVVGVVKNFNGSSLKTQMKPVALGSWKQVYQSINIKIQPGQTRQTLAAIEKLWTSTFPGFVYEYQFLDEKIAGFYRQEEEISQLFKVFAAIAIFISCLGLYGFVSFMARQRTREIGIRKVLGSSVSGIIYLFSKEFTLLIALAFLLAAPIAYFLMHKWLQHYAYRVTITASFFAVTLMGSALIGWITVGYQAIRAARANPVQSLRTQ